MASLAKSFMERFAGLDRAHGRYAVGADLTANAKGKFEGSRGTRHEPVTLDLWEQHLEGKIGLGIVPIRDDGTVVFAAGDIDIYDGLDLIALQAKVVKLDLPLIVTRTKSGGAHLYLFASEPIPAALARSKLLEWMVTLGHPGVEVFPKQTKLASENDVGNWINMPYCGGENSNRYGIKPDGSPLSPEQYLKLAKKLAVTTESLEGVKLPETPEDWREAPPCLQLLSQSGFSEGSRNNALFDIVIYLRKKHGDDWEKYVEHYNQTYFKPPLPHREMMITSRAAVRKVYNYKCKDMPICAVCNRSVCLKREFGVSAGASDSGVTFGTLVKLKTDPPTWIWDVNGERLELATADLMDQRRFQARCMEVLSIWPNPMKAEAWNDLIRSRLDEIEVVEVPVDATREGQLWNHLSDFCTSKVRGKALDEIMLGKPFTDEKRTSFRGTDFMQYLTQHRVSGISERDLWRWLRRMNATHHNKILKGKYVNYWSVPAFSEQTEDFSIPKTPTEAM